MQLFIKLTKTQENAKKCEKASKNGKKRQKMVIYKHINSGSLGTPLKRRGGCRRPE